MKSVLVFSKNTLYRECLMRIVSENDMAAKVTGVETHDELLQSFALNKPQFVIIDLYSRNFYDDPIAAILPLIDSDGILIITTVNNKHLSYYYNKYGITHFAFADQPYEDFINGMKLVFKGGNGYRFDKHDGLLTLRECEILKLIASGKTSKEIADQLCISKNTVDTHRNKMLQKLNMANSASLVQFAYDSGLL